VHAQLLAALDTAHDRITAIQTAARQDGDTARRPWPMILLVTPKGWTGPHEVDGVLVEGTWRAHQVPLAGTRENPEHRAQLESWLRSYRPEELFDAEGRLVPELKDLAPRGKRRMSANPHANGGLLRRPLDLPDFRAAAVEVPTPGGSVHEATRVLGQWLVDVVRRNPETFRLFGPDETASNRLDAVYEVTDKVFAGRIDDLDEHLSHTGREMEILS
jgi:xylulose-5-phosphate/fructose-6-phosphate phosphoketolase